RHARGRRLAVRPDDVDRAKALLRRAERRHEPAHPVQPEPHAEQLEPQQVALGLLEGHSASSSARSRSSLSRSAWTTVSGALPTKPSLASLPSARAISAVSSLRCASRLRASWTGSTPPQISTAPDDVNTVAASPSRAPSR